MKQILKWILIAAAAAVLLSLLVYSAGWLLSLRLGEKPELPAEAALSQLENVDVGAPVTGRIEFSLPLCRSVAAAELKPGDGSLAIGNVRIERAGWRFTRQVWRVSFELCALKEGAVGPGTLELEFSGEPPEQAIVGIPSFSATLMPPAQGTELEPAGAIDTSETPYWPWYAGIGALIAIVVAVILLLRRRMPEKSLWDRTLDALKELRAELSSGQTPPEQGYVRLTDIVRNYLEERFGIPVSTRTTPEFLAEFDRAPSPLPDTERPFLREFLEAADRVKFAALTPDNRLLTQALESAVRLVDSTRPAKPEGGAK